MKKTSRPKGRKGQKGKGGGRFFLAVILFVFLAVTLAISLRTIFFYPHPRVPDIAVEHGWSTSVNPPVPKRSQAMAQDQAPSRQEEKKASPAIPPAETAAKPSAAVSRVAIVIDDMGFEKKTGQELLNLPLVLSFAFLPQSPHLTELLTLAKSKGRDVLLHQPMEAMDTSWDPGPGALYLSMSTDKIAAVFSKNLAQVPGAIGVNNHMGSRFTADTRAMKAFLAEVNRHSLFFFDSLTTSTSVGLTVATQLGVTTAVRDVFLDAEPEEEKIMEQIERLCQIAQKRGSAIAIGHPKRQTLEALRKSRDLLTSSVQLVGLKELMRHQ